MPDNGNIFSADIPEILNGAPKIKQFSRIMEDISTNLLGAIEQYPLDDSGDDDISKSLKANYDPSRDQSLEFLKNLKELSEGHGQMLGDLGNLFNNMNENNTFQADGLPGHRH